MSITTEIKERLNHWFEEYTQSILDEHDQDEHIQLKIDHTKRVCDEILMIGRSLGLDAPSMDLAYVIALFHDIGRFEQFAAYKTFVDRDSVDHAAFGVGILEKYEVLKGLSQETSSLILTAIEHHNKAYLPELEEQQGLYAKMIRDADKLDIYKVVTDYYRISHIRESKAIQLNLPDTEGISPAVADDIRNHRIVLSEHLQNLNDFKLLQAAWVFDCNFPATYQAIGERGFLKLIRSHLPHTDEVEELFGELYKFLGTNPT